ncbi:non-ribosomal peptide synthetase [Enhygromyxa salina]|uniref:non-ribosomal peptide synthetase n=1 Tax=Enhygromyxa salina TaxID=215803 RepID=UPI0015E6A244|nr:non-ribosomal peptide synthetase [Enhygromyxa salina]
MPHDVARSIAATAMTTTDEPSKPGTRSNDEREHASTPPGDTATVRRSPDETTLVDILRERARSQPDAIVYTHLGAGETGAIHMTFAQLWARACAIAAALSERGLSGERALLVYPPGLEFAPALFGCLLAGVVAAPAAGEAPSQGGRAAQRLRAIVDAAAPRIVLTVSEMAELVSGLEQLATDQLPPVGFTPGPIKPASLAYLQYTSGSTSDPKGVMVSHANLYWNCVENDDVYAIREGSTMVCWVPPFHDMGLSYAVMIPVFGGARCVSLGADEFLRRPIRWLRAISRYRGTHSVAPNAAYDLAVTKTSAAEREGLDLRTWQMALNGAEPIRRATETRFLATYAPFGFAAEAFSHALGMAEATALVSAEQVGDRMRFLELDPAALQRGRVQVVVGEAQGLAVASCGVASERTQVRAIDPQTCSPVAADEIGELWVRGPSVGAGYFDRDGGLGEASAATFGAQIHGEGSGPWLRTGDLGFVRDRRIYVTGRRKDLIIIRGLNHHPQDLEASLLDAHDALRPGLAVAVGVPTEQGEALAILAEVRLDRLSDPEPVFERILGRIAAHGLRPRVIVLCPPNTVRKTTSGKLQRGAMRQLLLDGALPTLHRWDAPRGDQRDGGPTPIIALADIPEAQRRAHVLAGVQQIIGEVLDAPGDEPVSAEASLLELGLDSVALVQLIVRLEDVFEVELDTSVVLKSPVPGDLVELVLAASERRAQHPIIVAPTRSDEPTLHPLSPAQARLYFLDRVLARRETYNIQFAAKIEAAIDLRRLQTAVDLLVARHGQLRMHVVEGPQGPQQEILPALDVPVDVVVCADSEFARLVQERAAVCFDLGSAPLLRVTLARLGEHSSALLIVWHHIGTDGWSFGRFMHELEALYSTPALRLPAAPSYPELIAARRLEPRAADEHRRWWAAYLDGAEPLDLPTDHPPGRREPGGGQVSFALAAALSDQIDALARGLGVTPFVVLLTSWAIVMHRYSRQRDVVIGVISSGRTVKHAEHTIGLFVETLPVRCVLERAGSLAANIKAVGQSIYGALGHADLPLDEILGALPGLPRGEVGDTPLLRVALVLEQASWFSEQFAGAKLSQVGESVGGEVEGTNKFDLGLTLVRGAAGYRASLEFAAELFERETVERLTGHLRQVLAGMVAEPSVRLSALPMLTAAERELLLAWSETARVDRDELCIHELFAAQVRRTPDAVALVFEGTSLSFAGLAARVNRLAHHLRALGVGPEDRVGICLERSVELVVALLGVLSAGAAYVPLDPSYPDTRLQFMVNDAGLRVLLSDSRVALEWPQGTSRLDLDTLDEVLAGMPAGAPAQRIDPDNPAYVIYTSGSTGQPKGVCVPHRAVVNLFAALQDKLGYGPGDRWVTVASPSFDTSVLELLGSLVAGVTAVVASAETVQDCVALARLLEREHVTIMQATPSGWQRMFDAGWTGAPSLLALSGGEALPLELARRMVSHTGRMWTLYGPTEVTIYMTGTALGADLERVSVGPAVANVSMYVYDEHHGLRALGVPGELYVGGVAVTRGYLGRPALTAERYVPDPFGPPGSRMYRTGDLCRWRADGSLECLGRLDHQVKIRGFRIELGEVESVLGGHPAVRQCVVVAQRDDPNEARLVAYLVGERTPVTELRAWVGAAAPDYMVPSAFVWLEALPSTPNGKIDHKALPPPELDRAALSGGFVAPRTPTETALASIWSEALALDDVGIHDDFFELGGNSLRATTVASRMVSTLGVEMPLRALFEATTVAELARLVEDARADTDGEQLAQRRPIERAPRGQRLPLSHAQARMLFLDQLRPGTSEYNIPLALRLTGPLDVEALASALTWLVARHEALRTSLPSDADGAYQRIATAHTLTLVPEQVADDATLLARVREAAVGGFDLAEGPLLRVQLWRRDEGSHVLLLNVHHVAFDGWSTGVLLRELSHAYSAYAGGGAPSLPAARIDYADFAVWQRAWLEAGALARQLEYWKATLADAEMLELPTDHPRPTMRASRPGTVPVGFDVELSAGIEALARRAGATPFMVLLAGFAVVLGRWAQQQDIVVGSPIANRNRAEFEGVVGLFVNTLALRVTLEGDPTTQELVSRVRQTMLDAYANQDAPFERVVDALAVARDTSRTPVFQVMLALDDAPPEAVTLGPVELATLELDSEIAKFDLTLSLASTPGGLRGGLEYAADLFERETVERLTAHLGQVLTGMGADPSVRLSALPMLTAAERELLLAWNDTARSNRDHLCIHELFAEQVRRTPDAVAVVFEGTSLTYAGLAARAYRLAHHLRELGVGPEDRVGICLQRSVDFAVAMLAVLSAGAAYVPLDPSYPDNRLQFMARDAGLRVLLSDSTVTLEWPEGTNRLDLDSLGDALAGMPVSSPEQRTSPDNLAYVIYTSGSTGQPKGVALAHRGVVNLIADELRRFELTAGTPFLQFASFSFDASVSQLFVPLSIGARVVLASAHERGSPDALVELLRAEAVEIIDIPPALLPFVDPSELPALRVAIVGGEACPVADARRFLAAGGGGRRIVNAYGPTEATVSVAYWEARELDPDADNLPIGRPSANTQLHVLDQHLRRVPIGARGELYIGGVALARGYVGRPGVTAARFVPDPFGRSGARIYRTGDQCRWRRDGVLEYLGRVDRQVQVRGFRVELGEIEAALLEQAQVRQCVVEARRTAEGATQLVAYVVGGGAGDLEMAQLRAALTERLPSYMVPASFMQLDALPTTASGKIDRRALPEPRLDRGARAAGVAPRTPTEAALAGLWSQLLGLDDIGVHDNFFELGGHSLLMARLSTQVQLTLGVELPVREIFAAPTIAGLAAKLSTGVGPSATHEAIPRAPRDVPVPLSSSQARLWITARLQPDDAAYNVFSAHRLDGQLDRGALAATLRWLVERHESLRTSFVEHEGAVVLRIAEPDAAKLHDHLDVEVIEPACFSDSQVIAERLRARISQPFDLERGPLIRVHLITDGARAHVLVIVIHHIVVDGASIEVLHRELGAGYAAFVRGELPTLPPLPIQFSDYVAWERARYVGPALDRDLDYWRAQLADAPVLSMPTDAPRSAHVAARGGQHFGRLSEPRYTALQALAQANGATPFMVLLAAWAALLGRYDGQQEIVVGIPVSNREHADAAGLIGLFVNTLALRCDLGGAPSFLELLARVRATLSAGLEHGRAPFDRVVAALELDREAGRAPLVQTMLALDEAATQQLGLPGLEARELVGVGRDGAAFELTLGLTPRAGGLEAVLEYRADLFAPETIARVWDQFERLLAAVVEDPRVSVESIALLDTRELAQLRAWNDSARALASDRLVHERVADQAARSGHAIAVECGGQALSYAELCARAHRLAHALRAAGIGPEDRVGVLLDRSCELVVAVLAVLAAGAAYVPLDPEYPAQRLRAMIEDAELAALLTRSVDAPAWTNVGAHVDLDEQHGDWPIVAPDVVVAPENLAYAIFTSGSTGRPKAVAVAHAGLGNLVEATAREQGYAPGRRAMAFVSVSFDGMVHELWSTLSSGATLVMLTSAQRLSPVCIAEQLATVDVATLTPSALATVDPDAVFARRPAHAVRLCLGVAGEACSRALADRWASRCRMLNIYGPTETTVTSAWCSLEPSTDSHRPPPIGRPIANTQLHVLDAGLSPVPIGVPGQLYIAGIGLARGYLGHPGLTAERFVPDPSGGVGARMYQTGDRCRWLADGTLEFLGRTDAQIKIRGQRIEIGEIEAAVERAPGVVEAAVVLASLRGEQARALVAFVTVDAGAPADTGEIAVGLREQLSAAMLPALIVALPALPRTPNDKLDRRALVELAAQHARPERTYVAPRGPVELALAEIWASVLGRARVGADDDFFQIGGDSLAVMRVISRASARGLTISAQQVFAHPILVELAKVAVWAQVRDEPDESPGDPASAGVLSPNQRRIWRLMQRPSWTGSYNMVLGLRLLGPLDHAALLTALGSLVARQASLRTVLELVDGEPRQRVVAAERVVPVHSDLTHLDRAGRERALAERLEVALTRPFADAVPLARIELVTLAAEELALIIEVEHIVCDGWSLRVLMDELGALYQQAQGAGAIELEPLPTSFVRFARAQDRALRTGAHAAAIARGRERLRDAPRLALPIDHARPEPSSDRGALVRLRCPVEHARALEQLAEAQGTTMFVVLLAAWQLLLGDLCGAQDVVVGTMSANRAHPDVEALIGCFINPLAVRTDLSGDPSFVELLARVRRGSHEAVADQAAPFDAILEALGHDDGVGIPLVQSTLMFHQGSPFESTLGAAISVEPLPQPEVEELSRFELTASLTHDEAGLRGFLRYATDLFEPTTIRAIADRLVALLAVIVADPRQPSSALVSALGTVLSSGHSREGMQD